MSIVSIAELFEANGGVATYAQLHTVISRKAIESHLKKGDIVRLGRGVYSLGRPDTARRLAALDLSVGTPVVACMSTAADLYGFYTEGDQRIHILDPGVRVRPKVGLMVHQRVGAPLRRVDGRLATTPAWTAIEVARSLRRPRALATLDAALRSGTCTRAELESASREQRGRRGVVKVRELLPFADGRAESPMESYPSCSTRSSIGTDRCGVLISPGRTARSPPSTTAPIGMPTPSRSGMTG